MTASVEAPPREGMVWIEGGTFRMGDERFYPEEQPVRSVPVDGFWIDTTPVTVAAFRRFVRATGYVTTAEKPPDAAAYPDADPALLVPGSLVFQPTRGPVSLDDHTLWWAYIPGASWTTPEGPGSDTYMRAKHPVTHVTLEDAQAYCEWAGATLATEAEWEFAARGGLDGAAFAWGDEDDPRRVNRWVGEFPWRGHRGTSPVASFDANGYGLHDMTGNVWEWTADPFTLSPPEPGTASPPGEPSQRREAPGRVVAAPACHGPAPGNIPRQVIKGGSHLCAPSYCLRYRPAARQGETIETSTSHLGFRCVIRPT